MACSTCGESRFANEAQALCHGYRNHAPFTCGCEKKFFTEEELAKHMEKQKAAAKDKACDKCCRSFKEKDHLNSHKLAKDHWTTGEKEKVRADSGRSYCDCGKSFKTSQGLRDHIKAKPSLGREHRCFTCTYQFKTADSLNQHQRDTNHISKDFKSSKDARQNYLTNFRDKHVAVKGDDMRASVAVVKDNMDKIMAHVNKSEDGKIYSTNLTKAGSAAVKTKIGKADEFDYTVPLNVKDLHARDRGPLAYKFNSPNGETPRHMKGNCKLVDLPKSKEVIPNGYASASAKPGSVPNKLTHNGDLIPHYIQKDLHQKMSNAIKDLGLDKKGVSLSREAHGPALTLKITQPGKHDISVDVAPSLPSNLPVTSNCWPRPDTHKALSAGQIADVTTAGTHLVPKGERVFAVSYSKAEKALLKGLDAGNGCRKDCHKVMKRYVQEYSSKATGGIPGFSSHILKIRVGPAKSRHCPFTHQLFNMNEKHSSSDYWHQKNFGERVPDMMKDLERVLRTGKLPNYFNTGENILAGKDRNVLNGFAKYLKAEREKLLHIT